MKSSTLQVEGSAGTVHVICPEVQESLA